MYRFFIFFGVLFLISCNEKSQNIRIAEGIEGNWVVTSLIDRDCYSVGTFFKASETGWLNFFDKKKELVILFSEKIDQQYIYKIHKIVKNKKVFHWFSLIVYHGVAYVSPIYKKEYYIKDFIQSGQVPLNEFARSYRNKK